MEYSAEIVKALLWVIGLLGSLLGFFLTYYFFRTSKILDELRTAVQQLNLNYTGLNCVQKHDTINKRLEKHGVQLDLHERKITELDTKMNFK